MLSHCRVCYLKVIEVSQRPPPAAVDSCVLLVLLLMQQQQCFRFYAVLDSVTYTDYLNLAYV
jgi:hypothetical protein